MQYDPGRRFDLCRQEIRIERRKQLDEAGKRRVIEERIAAQLRLRRAEDQRILDQMYKESPDTIHYSKMEAELLKDKLEAEVELDQRFGGVEREGHPEDIL